MSEKNSDMNQIEDAHVSISQESTDRRAFIRNAAVVAGAAAATGLATSNASSATLNQKELIANTNTVAASFDPNYKVEIHQVQNIVEQILRFTGCPACGLVGIDLRLGLDPVIKVDSEIPVNVTMHGQY